MSDSRHSPGTDGQFDSSTVEILETDGVVGLANFFRPDALAQEFSTLMSDVPTDRVTQIQTVSGPVGSARWPQLLFDLIGRGDLHRIASSYFGKPAVLANWRAYRQLERSPIRHRAWEWHNDQRAEELKFMLLLTDVHSDGQPMQYSLGSHQRVDIPAWQAETIFDMDDALHLSDARIARATGASGTVFAFDPLGLHRGVRSQASVRDVITVTFCVDSPDAPVFPLPPVRSVSRHSVGPASASRAFRLPPIDGESLAGEIEQYRRTPTLEDSKPRLEDADDSVARLLRQHPSLDLSGDLDLPVRPGRADVERDIALVLVRDRLAGAGVGERFSNLVEVVERSNSPQTEPTLERTLPMLLAIAEKATRDAPCDVQASALAKLIYDLIASVLADRLVSHQACRTTLAFAVCAGVVVADALPDGSARAIEEILLDLARLYTVAVRSDDLGDR